MALGTSGRVNKPLFDLLKFSLIVSLRGHTQKKSININNHGLFIVFACVL